MGDLPQNRVVEPHSKLFMRILMANAEGAINTAQLGNELIDCPIVAVSHLKIIHVLTSCELGLLGCRIGNAEGVRVNIKPPGVKVPPGLTAEERL